MNHLKLSLKLILGFIILSLTACQTPIDLINMNGEIAVTNKVIYPKYRIWTTPSMGEEPAFNSPSFEWPANKKSNFDVRLSSKKDFTANMIEKNDIPFAIFNPHHTKTCK